MTENIYLMAPLSGNATKTFESKDGDWIKTESYKAGKWLNPYISKVKNLKEAFELFLKVENHPCFMIHGRFKDNVSLDEPIVRRKKLDPLDQLPPTIEDREIRLICLDLDGWEGKKALSADESIEEFIDELPAPFHTADYIRQFSSSYGLSSNKIKCHLFFWLSEPIYNTNIHSWIQLFNKEKGWGKIIDPAPLVCTQPIYLQRRICIGASDPVKEFIRYVEKFGELKFDFSSTPTLLTAEKEAKTAYDVTQGVELILKSEDYHNEINRLAMSLLNKRIPIQTTQDLIEGAMKAAKGGLSDLGRLADWQVRFDDIPRSIESAAVIVNNPSIEDLVLWASDADRKVVRMGFAEKGCKLEPIDRKIFIDAIEQRLGVGIKNIKDSIKIAEKEEAKKEELKNREVKSKKREAKGIHEVVVTLSNTEEACMKVSQILANSENGDRVFKAPGGLVRVGHGWPKTIRQVMKKHELGEDFPKIPIIQPYKAFSLGARIEKDTVFLNASGKEIPCPTNILKIVEEGLDESFSPLSGIIEHPFVNRDFKIVQKNGYDEQTGLYATLHHKLKLTSMPPQDAYKFLAYEVFDEFPFASDLDRCVAVSALLTCVQRPVIAGDSGFPGFAIVSPTQSSGKTTLAQLISYSVYNRAIAATSFTKDETELHKHLLAILKEGHACVLFDNMQAGAEVTSNVLAKAMSSDTLSGRLLGSTETIEVPSSVIWMFTGNSIQMQGDFATRIYPININANMENPDDRFFKRSDIGEWAISHRKKTMSAIISLVLSAKRPVKIAGASRFPVWDRFIRQSLWKVAKIDINEAINANKKNDSYLQAQINFLKILQKNYGSGNEFTTKDIMEEAFTDFDKKTTELGDLLVELLDKQAQSPKSVGRLLGRLRGIVLDGLVLRDGKTKVFPTKWRIEGV